MIRISAGRLARIAAALNVPVPGVLRRGGPQGRSQLYHLRSAGAVWLARVRGIAERGPKAALVTIAKALGRGGRQA